MNKKQLRKSKSFLFMPHFQNTVINNINLMRKSKTNTRKRRSTKGKYCKVHYKMRQKLIKMVEQDGFSIYRASRILGINNSTAKAIMRNYIKNNHIFRRKGEKSMELNPSQSPQNQQEMESNELQQKQMNGYYLCQVPYQLPYQEPYYVSQPYFFLPDMWFDYGFNQWNYSMNTSAIICSHTRFRDIFGYMSNLPKIICMQDVFKISNITRKKVDFKRCFLINLICSTSSMKIEHSLQKRPQILQNNQNQVEIQLILGNLQIFMILLNIVNQNGGIIIDGPFAFTQELSWIDKISQNMFKIGRNSSIQTIAFYDPRKSPKKEIFNIQLSEGMQQVVKMRTEFPAIQSFFIASVKQSAFIEALINQIYAVLRESDNIEELRINHGLAYKKYQQLSKKIIYTANHIVLKKMQAQIQKTSAPNSYKIFSYEHYGVAFLNSLYGPYKLDNIYKFYMTDNIYAAYFDMARYKIEDFYTLVGPIKYLCMLEKDDQLKIYLNESANGKNISIYRDSFLQKIYFPMGNESFIVQSPQMPFINQTNELWQQLPKKIWIFWDQGFQNGSAFLKMCADNLQRTAETSGFQIILLSKQNIGQYIPAQQLTIIETTINKQKYAKIQTFSDFYRLSVIYHYGGIYLDATSIALQNFDWILEIGRFPSQFIFNRFGNNPRVLLSFHPSAARPGTWSITNISSFQSIKSQWYLGYQNSFIAAQRHNQFIKEWKDLLFELINMPYNKILQTFAVNGVDKHTWISRSNQYLLPMDLAKCVLGRRQRIIQNDKNSKWVNAAHYYQLWSFNSYLANTKLRFNTNYDDSNQQINSYFVQYPIDYVQQIVGKVRFFIKLFSEQTEPWQKTYLPSLAEGNVENRTHSKSLFRKYMFSQRVRQFIKKQEKNEHLIQGMSKNI